MVLKLNRKVRKKWEELTTEEKVNSLELKREKDGVYDLFVLMMIFVVLLVAMLSFIQIYDIELQIGNFTNNQTMIDDATEKIEHSKNVIPGLSIFLFIILIGMFVSMYYIEYKWRPFLKSIKKDKIEKY